MGNLLSFLVCLFSLLAFVDTAIAQITPRIGGGEGFTCALGPSGRAFCWGSNTSGQIGNGAGMATTSRVSTPVEMAGGFSTIGGGLYHSCGLMRDGSAYCWGSDSYGQLGTGSSSGAAMSLPVRVTTSSAFRAITAGGMQGQSGVTCNGCNNSLDGEHTCALDPSGLAFCWGMNAHGQLGFPPAIPTSRVSLPTAVAPPGGPPAPVLHFKAISAGGAHTCAIDVAGDAWCWGSNVQGGAGLPICAGSTNWALQCDYTSPAKATASLGPGLKFNAISAGSLSTCGIDTTGTVQCWGRSSLRGSAVAATVKPNEPSSVTLPAAAVAISVGATSVCAVDATGGLSCWGNRDHGQIGDGTPPGAGTQVTPKPVSGPQDYVSVSVGFSQACGLTRTGGVRCWGFFDAHHLGLTGAATIGSASPVDVVGLRSTQLSFGGDHVCSIDPLGITSCWGDNAVGQIGHGQAVTAPVLSVVPTPVSRSFSAALITVHPPALPVPPPETLLPQVVPQTKPHAIPKRAETLNFTALSVGGQHACVLSDAGRAYCWGQDGLGQIGNGSRTHAACRFGVGSAMTCVPFPTIVSRAPLDVFQDIAAGAAHSCARDSGKFVRCWGSAGFGELGSPITPGTTPTCARNANQQPFCRAPIGITLPPGIRARMLALASDDSSSCAVNEVAEIWCWGTMSLGGPGALTAAAPVQMPYPNGPNYVRVGSGGNVLCVGAQNGAVQCLGDDNIGQLGDGTNTSSATPTLVSGHLLAPFVTGRNFSCGIEAGAVLCWGDNSSGQLGGGTAGANSNVPVAVGLGTGFTPVNVGAGFAHGCAIDQTGAAFCWGSNTSGELGDGKSSVLSSAPVAVAGGWKVP